MNFQILIILFFSFCLVTSSGCKPSENKTGNDLNTTIDYKKEMRHFIQDISLYAKHINSNFYIVVQNAQALITDSGDADGQINSEYINSIDGSGRESLLYGYKNRLDKLTPEKSYTEILKLCKLVSNLNISLMITDYCKDIDNVNDSYKKNQENGFISFAASSFALNRIPDYPDPVFNKNNEDINSLSSAKNFLYILDNSKYKAKEDFINSIDNTNYDIIIMDLFLFDDLRFSKQEINSLKKKKNKGKRIILAYMSIGEAESYRYYWNKIWESKQPSWLLEENPEWKNNYKVKYWEKEWQNIIYGDKNAYLDTILDSGFDGVYIDRADAYEYFE